MRIFSNVKKLLCKSKNQENKIEVQKDNEQYEINKYATNSDKTVLLTKREYDLFLLLIEGYTLKESAKQLNIKYSTANTHMTSIYKKLSVNSRAELIIKYRNINSGENGF